MTPIAQTIIQQVIAIDPWSFGAYAASDFISISECSDYAGGLSFKVNGKRHKGNVMIFLKWSDVYHIVFMSKEGVPVKAFDDVYCEELIKALDYIEGIRYR